jgi:hypothetical protein
VIRLLISPHLAGAGSFMLSTNCALLIPPLACPIWCASLLWYGHQPAESFPTSLEERGWLL